MSLNTPNTTPESGASLLESTNLPYRSAQVETKIGVNDALEHDSKNPFAKFQLRKLAKSINIALWKEAEEHSTLLPTSFDWQAVEAWLKEKVTMQAEYNQESVAYAEDKSFDTLIKWEWNLADQLKSIMPAANDIPKVEEKQAIAA